MPRTTPPLTRDEAERLLRAERQEHVLRFWERLQTAEREALLAQIAALDWHALRRMRALLLEHPAAASRQAAEKEEEEELTPADVVEPTPAERAAATARGEAELRAGRVGALLVAGGQGSRLGFDGPKGAYPIGPVSNAPIFHFHARKILALERAYGARLPFYVMTSETNDAATRACFESHGWFGLDPAGVRFFRQGMWPALDPQGRIILDRPGHIFMSPDGHGGALSALADSGALAEMESQGLSTLFYFQVDNPLVDVADPAFVGIHLLRQAEMSLKVCAKRDPHEGLGVVVRRGGRHAMVEYTELTESQKSRRRPDGELHLKYGSVAIHLFALPFLQREARHDLPLHVARKKIPFCDDDGRTLQPDAPNGCKFEKFIFDLLPQASRIVVLAFDRREEFSPVKNAAGPDSPESCRRDLSAKWARWLRTAGVPVPLDEAGHPPVPVEIDPLYAHSAATLRARLAGSPPPDCSRPVWLRCP